MHLEAITMEEAERRKKQASENDQQIKVMQNSKLTAQKDLETLS